MKKYDVFAGFLRKTAVYGVCGAMLLVLLCFTAASLLTSYGMDMDNSMKENVVFYYDSIPLNLLLLAAGGMLLYMCRSVALRVKPGVLTAVTLLWTILLGAVWVLAAKSAPTQDSYIVTHAAQGCADGDYTALADTYFRHFPFQLGYVFYSELLIRLLRLDGNYQALEFVNVLFLALAYYALLRIVRCITPKQSVYRLTALLLLLCLPGVLFCTFLYGNIPGFAFSMLAVWCTLEFLKKRTWYVAAAGALCIGAAVALKLNNMIVLAAIVILVFIDTVCERKWLSLAYIAAAVVLALGTQSAAVVSYEKRAGLDFGDGIPMVSWMAMGLSEGKIASGWYNGIYTKTNFDNKGMDAERAAEASLEVVRERLDTFLADPAYAGRFFSEKVFSQWNEPTYQSIWTNEVRGFYGGADSRWAIAKWVCGDGEALVTSFMNAYQQLIFCCSLLAAFFCLRKKNFGVTLLLLIFLGGVLYHLVFEAKSQYALTYFILMVPLAAYGADELAEALAAALAGRRGAVKMKNE